MRRRNLANVTITMEPPVARWARTQAARRGRSMSRFVGEMLKERMGEEQDYAAAMERSLARRAFLKTDGRYVNREALHDRARLR